MTIDDAFIESIGSSSIGLGALEYLLFDPEGGNDALLAHYTTAENADRRRVYLLAVALTGRFWGTDRRFTRRP